MSQHSTWLESDCMHREFICEGRTFANWCCPWIGNYGQLRKHFEKDHQRTIMKAKFEKNLNINLEQNNRDVQLISYFNGKQYFWYKLMVDISQQKVYWVVQFIGPRQQAKNYCYQLEINYQGIRYFRVCEICNNDAIRADDLFNQEKCVVLSFKALRSYLNDEGQLPVRFVIMTTSTAKKYIDG